MPAEFMMHKDTVFIIDDDASVRDSLALLLSLRGHVTALFASAEDFLAAFEPNWRGCLVLDIRMPGMSGLELLHCLRERKATLPVIVITAHGDVAAARQAFLADALDFIEKPFDGQVLLGVIEKALAGLPPVAAVEDGASALKSRLGRLSAREREVMTLMTQGLHNRRIAEELGISPRTVEVHRARVMEKLGVQNLVELVRLVDKGVA
jgi:FixJ family two-component response regulator